MALSAGEAAENLREIQRTGERSATAYLYANASPQFMLWGLVWMLGYAGTDLLVPKGPLINALWFLLSAAGVTGSVIIGRRQRGAQSEGMRGLRWTASMFALGVFVCAVTAVTRPTNPAAIGALMPLMVAVIYTIFGIWNGMRFLYAGIAVAALTLGGWLYLPQHFLLWMAAIGGGSLILVGLWLRKI
jgi:hypothetical protein